MVHVIDLEFLDLNLAIAVFLVETEDGLVLVETGPHSCIKRIEKGIEALGFSMQDIKHVLLTHIHLDHAGAAWAFANHGATIYVHPFGQRHLADPSKLMKSARRIYQDQMDRLWGEMHPIPVKQLVMVEDEVEITIGKVTFKSWHTPGHAVHHIAWQMNDILFAGDVAGTRINKGLVIPPCPPPDINIEDWKKSIALIRTLDISKMYITHFGDITDIDAHLNDLEYRLEAWANWIKPHWEAGKKPQEIVPIFQEYVKQDMRAHGTPEEEIAQSEAANPAWMSVAGLMRYWTKKTAKK